MDFKFFISSLKELCYYTILSVYLRSKIFMLILACGKKYENEFFSSYFGASVLADEEVAVIAKCAG